MQENYTHVTFVLDASGSMGSILEDTIGGFNSFLKSQKEITGKATASFFKFNGNGYNYGGVAGGFDGSRRMIGQSIWPFNNEGEGIKLLSDFVDIQSVTELDKTNFVPTGGTPLLDAIGYAIEHTGDKLKALPEALRPGKVLILIITDGGENTSKAFTNKVINERIAHQETVYKWQFLYVGANQDAIKEASKFGLESKRSLSYGVSGQSIGSTYNLLNSKIASYRSSTIGDNTALDVTAMDRAAAVIGEVNPAPNVSPPASSGNVVFGVATSKGA